MSYTFMDFRHDCVELLREMKDTYSIAHEAGEYLQILMGVNEGQARLYYLDSINCLPGEVSNNMVFIGNNELAEVFRKHWTQQMTMVDTAKLGAFIIKYVEREGLSDGIGVGQSQPQVWFIADNSNPREIEGRELVNLLVDVDPKVEAMRTTVHSLFRS